MSTDPGNIPPVLTPLLDAATLAGFPRDKAIAELQRLGSVLGFGSDAFVSQAINFLTSLTGADFGNNLRKGILDEILALTGHGPVPGGFDASMTA